MSEIDLKQPKGDWDQDWQQRVLKSGVLVLQSMCHHCSGELQYVVFCFSLLALQH